jgi:hypothetical protein
MQMKVSKPKNIHCNWQIIYQMPELFTVDTFWSHIDHKSTSTLRRERTRPISILAIDSMGEMFLQSEATYILWKTTTTHNTTPLDLIVAE